jgi:GT2 family glycosyltransferase
VLYLWRSYKGAGGFSHTARDRAAEAARRAIAEHLAASGEPADVVAGPAGYHAVIRQVPEPAPQVGVLIPTRDAAAHLSACLQALGHTDYAPWQLILIDNGTVEPRALSLLAEAETGGAMVLRRPGAFNFAHLINEGARAAAAMGAEHLCLLNNDVVPLHAGWLTTLVAQGVRADVGAVGAKLYYPDGRIQHAGVILGLNGAAHHPFRGRAEGEWTYFARDALAHEVSAVTGACLLTRTDLFHDVGGMDEAVFPVAFNDVDYCLKLRARGLRVMYEPKARLVHVESASRGDDGADADKAARLARDGEALRARWAQWLAADPAYSPNLSLTGEAFRPAFPPRVRSLGDWVVGM